jgi:hypothetical protein
MNEQACLLLTKLADEAGPSPTAAAAAAAMKGGVDGNGNGGGGGVPRRYTLSERVDFLSRALVCASECLRKAPPATAAAAAVAAAASQPIDGDLVAQLRDRIEIAKIQVRCALTFIFLCFRFFSVSETFPHALTPAR